MILEIDLELIKEVGLNATIVFSYLNKKRNNIKAKEFFSVKYKEIEKQLGIKRHSLKTAICQLEKGKLVEINVVKNLIFRDVRFKILRNEKTKNEKTIVRQTPINPDVDFYDNTASLDAEIYDNIASNALKSGVDFYDNTASNTVLKSTTTPHKHTAASIYTSNNINIITLIKKETQPKGFAKIDDVRKNLLGYLKPNQGSDKKQTTSSASKKPSNLTSKPKIGIVARVGSFEREKTTIMAQEIVNYLNEKTSKKFNISAESNLKNIRARISEGYKLEDFKNVIDKKSSDWNSLVFSNGKPASNYLRPSTLFASKNFENYLNEENPNKKENIMFKNDLDRDLYNFFIKNGCQPS